MSKILVVDDEVQIRTLLSRMLELEGYEVCQAGDCRTALKQLEFQSPDVVLCDVFLPDGNGVDLVSSVKKTAPNVEIILLTAHGNIPDGVQAIKNGAFDYNVWLAQRPPFPYPFHPSVIRAHPFPILSVPVKRHLSMLSNHPKQNRKNTYALLSFPVSPSRIS